MNNIERLLLVKDLLNKGNAEKAKELFYEINEEDTVDYHFVNGLLKQKFQQWGDAINSFNKVIVLDAEHFEAKNHIEMIQSILKFWNPEMFNP